MLDDAFTPLLEAARAGAEWAWRRLYEDLSGQILGYIRRQGARDAEDLLGEVWLQVARNIGTFEGDETNFRSWIFTVAHHRVIDERRRSGRRREDPVADLPETPSDDIAARSALDSIATDRAQGLLDRLAPAQRDVLLLRIVGGLTVAEVAEALDKRPGAIKALQRRGVEALRRLLEREGVSL